MTTRSYGPRYRPGRACHAGRPHGQGHDRRESHPARWHLGMHGRGVVRRSLPPAQTSAFAGSYGAPPAGFEPAHTAPETVSRLAKWTALTCGNIWLGRTPAIVLSRLSRGS